MKKELEEKLVRKFPVIFSNIGSTPEESCMAFGVECDDGWYDIIYALCECIQKYCDENKLTVKADQIKEKFGTLRFYFTGGDAFVDILVDMAEIFSGRTCERCGDKGKLGGKFWIKCLCEKCRKEIDAK